MLSSMSPTIVTKDGKLFLVTGSPGGRTIINTTLHVILNSIDFGMDVGEAVSAPREDFEWLPEVVTYERNALPDSVVKTLEGMGHRIRVTGGSPAVPVLTAATVAARRFAPAIDRPAPATRASIQMNTAAPSATDPPLAGTSRGISGVSMTRKANPSPAATRVAPTRVRPTMEPSLEGRKAEMVCMATMLKGLGGRGQ
jgi:hypothetical protein